MPMFFSFAACWRSALTLRMSFSNRRPLAASRSSRAQRARIGLREIRASSGRRNRVRLVMSSRKARSWLAATTAQSRGRPARNLSSTPILPRSRWFVGSSSSSNRLDHRGPGQQHRALPAAGQVANRAAAQPLVHREIIEQNIDAPAFGFRGLGVQRTHARLHRNSEAGGVRRIPAARMR